MLIIKCYVPIMINVFHKRHHHHGDHYYQSSHSDVHYSHSFHYRSHARWHLRAGHVRDRPDGARAWQDIENARKTACPVARRVPQTPKPRECQRPVASPRRRDDGRASPAEPSLFGVVLSFCSLLFCFCFVVLLLTLGSFVFLKILKMFNGLFCFVLVLVFGLFVLFCRFAGVLGRGHVRGRRRDGSHARRLDPSHGDLLSDPNWIRQIPRRRQVPSAARSRPNR